MLVISQKKGEKLHIGRDITVTVVDIKANKVRLGIEAPSELTILAPSELTILRDQLYAQSQEQEREQAQERSRQQRTSGAAGSNATQELELESEPNEH